MFHSPMRQWFLTALALFASMLVASCGSGSISPTLAPTQAAAQTLPTSAPTETNAPTVIPTAVPTQTPAPTFTPTTEPTTSVMSTTPPISVPTASPTQTTAPATLTEADATRPTPEKLDINAIFPQGSGRELVLDNCLACHTFVRIVLGQRNKDEWAMVRRKMRPDVSRLSDAEADSLFGYLEATFNETKPVPILPDWLLVQDTW